MLRERFDEALKLYDELQRVDDEEPRWPHRKGDLLKRLNRKQEAVIAYERAVDLYADQGFVARAAAMAKVIMSIDKNRSDVLERVDPEAARKLHRSARSTVVTADQRDRDDETTKQRIITDALPLVQDKSADSGQLRFTKPPTAKRPTIELELSDLEIAERPTQKRTAVSTVSMLPSAQELAHLPSISLFAEVPQEVLSTLVRESRLIDLEDGQTLIEAGTTADALYALIEGSVDLMRGSDDEPVALWEGDVVGVSCLLSHVNYDADAVARGRVRALRISKLLLDRLVSEVPEVEDILLEVLGRRLVSNLVRTSSMFTAFDDQTRIEVANMFEVRRAAAGMTLLVCGKRTDGLYIPLLGSLRAIGANGQEIGQVKLGRALGQRSLITKAPSPVTVEAITELLVLRMAASRFRELTAKHPNVVSHLEELARRPSEASISLIPNPPTSTG